MMSGYKLYTLEKIAQHKTWWKFQWPILLPGVKDLIEQESMKALKGSRPLFSYCCKMLWKTLEGTGVLLKNYRQIYKFKRKSINLVNVIIFILMLRIWWVWSITIDKTSNNLTNTDILDIYVNPESFGRLKHASKMVSRYQSNMPQPTTGLKADKMSNKY